MQDTDARRAQRTCPQSEERVTTTSTEANGALAAALSGCVARPVQSSLEFGNVGELLAARSDSKPPRASGVSLRSDLTSDASTEVSSQLFAISE